MKRYVLLVVLALATACHEQPAGPLPGVLVENETADRSHASSTRLRYRVDEPVWGQLPFPNDAYLVGGSPTVPEGFPNPRASEPLFARIGELLKTRSGFCTTCNVTFWFDGAVKPETLEDNISFVDLSDGRAVSAQYEWHADSNELVVRPELGAALGPGRRYAVVLSTGVLGEDGKPVRIRPELLANATLAATFAELEAAGLQPSDLAAFTTFATDEPIRELKAVRRHVMGSTPIASVDRVYGDEELTGLLGQNSTQEAGRDVLAADELGTYAVRHATTQLVVTGSFTAPRFIDASPGDIGVVVRDVAGLPTAAGEHVVPFALIVPEGVDPTDLPLLVVHHGFSASRATGLLLADTAGRAGWAVLAIDAYQHGARAPSASDRVHAMRGGLEGPDGFPETNKLDVVARVFGMSGVDRDIALSPEFALSAFLQFGADVQTTFHFARQGDLSAIRAVPGLEGLAFDPDRLVYLGNSMGAVVGVGLTAVEDGLAGAVLDVMPGSIVETLAESGEFRPLSERVFLPLLGVDRKFDELERRMLFDPTVDLYRWVLEPVDPLALATSRATERVLVQLASHDEVAPPRPSESVVAAAGFDEVSRYPGAGHTMMESNVEESRFVAPLIPPLAHREEPEGVRNPTAAVHDEITTFLLEIGTK